jgi:hypothetical protein
VPPEAIMVRVPRRERQERRKMAPFLAQFRKILCTVLSVDKSIRALSTAGVLDWAPRRQASIKVPDCLARGRGMNIWFEYDEHCHSLHRAPKTPGRRDRYSGAKEADRMCEVFADLHRLTGLPTALVRYAAEPARYDVDGRRCSDNPPLTRGQRTELCQSVLRTVAELLPPLGHLLVIYVGYAKSARSVARTLESVHVQSREDAQSLRGELVLRGWRPHELS